MMRRVISIFGLAFLGLVSNSMAGPLSFTGSSSGIFLNPVAEVEGQMVVTGVGTNFFEWGGVPRDASGNPTITPPSSLFFEGIHGLYVTAGSPFQIGTLTFFNGMTDPNTGAQSVDLQINIELTVFDPVTAQTLTLVNTPFDAVPNSDQVIFPGSWPAQVFALGNTSFSFQLLGFFDENLNKFDRFDVWETGSASANIWANVTPVPEPSSSVLLGLGLLTVFSFASCFRDCRS